MNSLVTIQREFTEQNFPDAVQGGSNFRLWMKS